MLDFPILNMISGFEHYVDIMISTLSAAGFKNNFSIHLNRESFLYAQNEENSFNFNFKKLPFKFKIPLVENLNTLKENYSLKKTEISKSTDKNLEINSIFKPVILNIVDPRF
jgi:hypothetical protein